MKGEKGDHEEEQAPCRPLFERREKKTDTQQDFDQPTDIIDGQFGQKIGNKSIIELRMQKVIDAPINHEEGKEDGGDLFDSFHSGIW